MRTRLVFAWTVTNDSRNFQGWMLLLILCYFHLVINPFHASTHCHYHIWKKLLYFRFLHSKAKCLAICSHQIIQKDSIQSVIDDNLQ